MIIKSYGKLLNPDTEKFVVGGEVTIVFKNDIARSTILLDEKTQIQDDQLFILDLGGEQKDSVNLTKHLIDPSAISDEEFHKYDVVFGGNHWRTQEFVNWMRSQS